MNSTTRFYLIILFSIFSLSFFNCNSQSEEEAELMQDNSKIYTGKIIKVNFTDKGGNIHEDIFDYFFKTDEGEYFIKISEGDVSRDEIAKHYNKEIKVRAIIILFGLWDTDDPNVQSRVGDYLVFKEIL